MIKILKNKQFFRNLHMQKKNPWGSSVQKSKISKIKILEAFDLSSSECLKESTFLKGNSATNHLKDWLLSTNQDVFHILEVIFNVYQLTSDDFTSIISKTALMMHQSTSRIKYIVTIYTNCPKIEQQGLYFEHFGLWALWLLFL